MTAASVGLKAGEYLAITTGMQGACAANPFFAGDPRIGAVSQGHDGRSHKHDDENGDSNSGDNELPWNRGGQRFGNGRTKAGS